MDSPAVTTKLNPVQRNVTFACIASWTLDAFDFFILVFVMPYMGPYFHVPISSVSIAIMLTLAVRPIGALIFGRLAEAFGRRPILMVNILMFSIFELASALAPTLAVFITLRVIYGIAMGGIWGVASSLAMESVPDNKRGMLSGLFQAGYPAGYLIAAIVFGVAYDHIGWRGMFLVGTLPVLLIPFVYFKVPESPVWLAARNQQKHHQPLWPVLMENWRVCVFMIILMACFNSFSHSQDIYPTFLKVQHGFTVHQISIVAIVYNITSIIGASFFGTISQRIGRRAAIILAALISLPVLPFWAWSSNSANSFWILIIGAAVMQMLVQGAWGVIPSYLNELSPASARATLPGFVYQAGNLLASFNIRWMLGIGESHHNNYSGIMMIVAGGAAVLIAILIWRSVETKEVRITGT